MNKLLLCSDLLTELSKRAKLKSQIYLNENLDLYEYKIASISKNQITFTFFSNVYYEISLTDTECNMDDDEFESHLQNNIDSWNEINALKQKHSWSM